MHTVWIINIIIIISTINKQANIIELMSNLTLNNIKNDNNKTTIIHVINVDVLVVPVMLQMMMVPLSNICTYVMNASKEGNIFALQLISNISSYLHHTLGMPVATWSSMPHSLLPRLMRKKPFSPQLSPQLFAQSQYGSSWVAS